MKQLRGRWWGGSLLILVSSWAWASPGLPLCSDGKKDLPVMSDTVLTWKSSTPNQYKARARVRGTVTRIFDGNSDHAHFEIQIGKNPGDVLEVVYNVAFGKLPKIAPQMDVEACGVYITSNAPTNQYPESPSGAIIHWVHINPKKRGEPDGYLAVNGELFGQLR